jgi:hypothetical protein
MPAKKCTTGTLINIEDEKVGYNSTHLKNIPLKPGTFLAAARFTTSGRPVTLVVGA